MIGSKDTREIERLFQTEKRRADEELGHDMEGNPSGPDTVYARCRRDPCPSQLVIGNKDGRLQVIIRVESRCIAASKDAEVDR